MTAWEYQIVSRSEENALTEAQLDTLGGAGMELVSVAVTSHEAIVIGRPERKNTLHYFFKRPLPEGAQAAPETTAAAPREAPAGESPV
jgi:hypothetical protein